jgi:transcriptional regulator with XRE-family HTH domain
MTKSSAPMGRRKALPFDEHLGKKIRELRKAAGLNQTELGKPLSLSYQQIQKFENGQNRIGSGQLWQICEFLNVSIAAMFEGVNSTMFKAKPRRRK